MVLRRPFLIIGGAALLFFLLRPKKAAGLVNYGPNKLGEFFDLEEFTKSQTAEQWQDEFPQLASQWNPAQSKITNGRKLAQWTLDPIRRFVGSPVMVTSWYRSPELNQFFIDMEMYDAAVNSNHMTGAVADIVYFNPEDDLKDIPKLIQAVLLSGAAFDRLLIEGGTLEQPLWLHIEIDPTKGPVDQRGQIMRIYPGTTSGYIIPTSEALEMYT